MMTETRSLSAADSLADAAGPPSTPQTRSIRSPATVYRVEEADLGVAGEQIARLWQANLDGYTAESSERKLLSGYLHNPAGLGVVLLLMSDAAPDAAGVQCLHPRRLHWGRTVLDGASIADFAVAREHRSLGPALMLIRAIAATGSERFDRVYGLPNASAAAVCRRGGLCQVAGIQRYVKVLRWQHLLARRMPSPAATLLSTAAEPLRLLYEGARRLKVRPWLHGREAGWHDPAIDQIWARRPADLLMSERSAAMLAWRFSGGEGQPWRLWIASDSSEVAQGYVVWRLKDGVAEIGDLFAAKPHRHLAPLLRAYFRAVSRERALSVSMEFTATAPLVAALRKAGMVPRGEPSPVFEVPTGDSANTPPPDRWYLTRFDNDSD